MCETQKKLSEAQLVKFKQNLDLSDNYQFRKKGNEEQFKVNSKVLGSLSEAKDELADMITEGSTKAEAATQKVVEGMNTLIHRQKLIKLADSTDLGWRVVKEYEAHPLAEGSDDEKKTYRAQIQADRKAKQDRRSRTKRFSPYTVMGTNTASSTTTSQGSSRIQTLGRKPGLCFRCGKPGHWQADCKVKVTETQDASVQKISSFLEFKKLPEIAWQSAHEGILPNVSSSISNHRVTTPVGRLRENIAHWKKSGADGYVLDVIENGYKLPLKEIPGKVELRNNKSARENGDIVWSEICKLLEKGCISEIKNIPHVVNPLTVAFNRSGKPRLVLDCRHVNLALFKNTCTFEDQKIAKQLFSKGNFLFSFDLKSAYHHIEIFDPHRTFLGFAWVQNGRKGYYLFNVLPFGICVAGYIFTKVLRVVVKHWRSKGYKIVLFLDDGLGGDTTFDKAYLRSQFMKSDLQLFGFLLAEDKCVWKPSQIVVWLGYVWNTFTGKLSVTDERMQRFERMLGSIINQVTEGKILIQIRKLACLVGLLMSMKFTVGTAVSLRSRAMYACISQRASWNAPVSVTADALSEMIFWKENVRSMNSSDIVVATGDSINHCTVFSDASDLGYGGYIEGASHREVTGSWSPSEADTSSTLRELEAVHRVLLSKVESLEGQQVTWNTDSKNASIILSKGSSKPYLQSIALEVDNMCRQKDITLNPRSVPRSKNYDADFLSRCCDSDDWAVQDWVFWTLEKKWGKHTFDRFAHDYNAKCPMFNSSFGVQEPAE